MDGFIQTFTDWQRVLPQAIKLVIAFLLALPIAFNREKSTRIMGMRTFPLVAVASCGFILIALGMSEGDPQAQARILQGLITGIGFIGGGAILKSDGGVKGTATAASIWGTGAVGAAVAFGYLAIALLIALMTFFVLYFLTPAKERINSKGETSN